MTVNQPNVRTSCSGGSRMTAGHCLRPIAAVCVTIVAMMGAGCTPSFCINCRHVYTIQRGEEKPQDGQAELDRILKSLEDADGNAEKNGEK